MNFSEKQYLLGIGVILLLTCAVYFPGLENGFTNWDDDKYILNSELIRDFSLHQIFTSFTVGLYTPLTTLSYCIDYKMYGLDPWGYHFTSLCLHLLNTFFVVLFVHKLTGKTFLALLVGLFFAIHPTHVEAVAWASSRKDLLYSLFSLLAMICFVSWQSDNKWKNYVFCGLFFIMACLSKPTALGLPLVFAGLDFIRSNKLTWKSFRIQVPFLLFSGVIFVTAIYGVNTLNIKINPETGYSFWQVICMASYGLVFYFYKALFPLRLSNFHIYPFPGKEIPTEYILAPFILAIICYLFVKFRRRIPGLNTGLILFLVILLPAYRIYPAGFPIVAERYFYLSSIGVFFILGSFIDSNMYTKTSVINIATVFILVISISVLGFGSYFRTKVWKNSMTLWSNTIKTYPDFYYAYSERGKYQLSAGNKQGALNDFNKSLLLQPNNPELLNLSSNLFMEMGDTLNAKRYINESLKKDTANYVFHFNRANIFKAEGRYKEAVAGYDQCLKINPGIAEAYNNRGVSRIFLGDTLNAVLDFRNATKLDPQNKMFQDNMARAESLK